MLLDTIAQYGAKGSFDVIGDASENYPDEAGKLNNVAALGAASNSTTTPISTATTRAEPCTTTA